MEPTLRPFTETDWYSYAGAETAPDGTEPHIASIGGNTLEGGSQYDWDVVMDANCVQVHACSETGYTGTWHGAEHLQGAQRTLLARLAMRALQVHHYDQTRMEALALLGFEYLGD